MFGPYTGTGCSAAGELRSESQKPKERKGDSFAAAQVNSMESLGDVAPSQPPLQSGTGLHS